VKKVRQWGAQGGLLTEVRKSQRVAGGKMSKIIVAPGDKDGSRIGFAGGMEEFGFSVWGGLRSTGASDCGAESGSAGEDTEQ